MSADCHHPRRDVVVVNWIGPVVEGREAEQRDAALDELLGGCVEV